LTELVTTDWRADATALPLGRMQQIDARVRIVLAAAFALTCVALESLPLLVAALCVAAALAALARLPVAPTLKRMLGIDAFMIPILVLLPFTVPGEAAGAVGPWTITAEGMHQAAKIVLTANAVVLALLGLVGTIEPVRLGQALLGLGAPEKLARMLLLTTRYVGVLYAEYARLRLAMRARAFRCAGTLHTWRSIGYLFGMLLVRSVERAERIGDAMKCRGFTGRFPAADFAPPSAGDWAFAAATSAVLLLLVVLEAAG
jgi:cobalt ABC transporter, permease protein CbiQ